MNTSNLHAANATSVVGNAMAIPPRVTTAAPTPAPAATTQTAPSATDNANANANAAVQPPQTPPQQTQTQTQTQPSNASVSAAAAMAAQMSLNQMRAAFTKPAAAAAGTGANPTSAASTAGMTQATLPVSVAMAPSGQQPIAAATSAPMGGMPVAVAVAAAPAIAVNPAVPNTAGAGALNLSGRWYLDREGSDSTNDYLEAMGLPLIARQAADKLDLMVIITQTPGDFVITRRTRIFMETKHLKFGQDVTVKNNVIKVTGDPQLIKTVTQLSGYRGLLTDLRTIDDKGRMRVELTLQLPDRTPVIICRYFKKTSESTSLDNLPAFDLSLEMSGDVKRKR